MFRQHDSTMFSIEVISPSGLIQYFLIRIYQNHISRWWEAAHFKAVWTVYVPQMASLWHLVVLCLDHKEFLLPSQVASDLTKHRTSPSQPDTHNNNCSMARCCRWSARLCPSPKLSANEVLPSSLHPWIEAVESSHQCLKDMKIHGA